jgi:hypothetical protein
MKNRESQNHSPFLISALIILISVFSYLFSESEFLLQLRCDYLKSNCEETLSDPSISYQKGEPTGPDGNKLTYEGEEIKSPTDQDAASQPASVQENNQKKVLTNAPDSAKEEDTSLNLNTEPVFVDNVLKAEQEKISQFKELIHLQFDLPAGMSPIQLDLDHNVAGLQADDSQRKILILATARSVSPDEIATFLRDQKSQIPMLNKFDFQISGEIRQIPPPVSSGISTISIFPGGVNGKNPVYAAHLERADKKGSYVFVMEANSNQFELHEGDFDIMMKSLKTRP